MMYLLQCQMIVITCSHCLCFEEKELVVVLFHNPLGLVLVIVEEVKLVVFVLLVQLW